jgi:hypothetical protein
MRRLYHGVNRFLSSPINTVQGPNQVKRLCRWLRKARLSLLWCAGHTPQSSLLFWPVRIQEQCRHSAWQRIMASLHSALRINPCKFAASGGMRAGKQPGASRPPWSKHSGLAFRRNRQQWTEPERTGCVVRHCPVEKEILRFRSGGASLISLTALYPESWTLLRERHSTIRLGHAN